MKREIAQVTKTARPVMDGATTRTHLLASAIVDGRIITLETYVGALWGAASDEQVQERASRIVRELENELHAPGLDARGGIRQVP